MIGIPGLEGNFTSYKHEELKPKVGSMRIKFTGEVEICTLTERRNGFGFRAIWENYEEFLYRKRVVAVPISHDPRSQPRYCSIKELLEEVSRRGLPF